MSRLSEMIKKLCPNGVEYKRLGEVIDYEQPSKYIVRDTNYDDAYETPVLTAGQTFILGYTNETDNHYKASKENPVIIFDDFTTAFQWVDFEFKVKSSAMKMLSSKDDTIASLRYVFYAMQCIHYQPVDHSRHWIEKYSKIEIPLPPLEIQCEIVQILDNFANLTAELTAELAKRKKQYEHYRDMLLNFEGGRYDKLPISVLCNISRGRVMSKQYLREHVGKFPVFSSQTANGGVFGYIDSYDYDGEYLTWTTDGANAGSVFYQNGKFSITNVCGLVKAKSNRINIKYAYYYLAKNAKQYVSSGMGNPKLMSNVMGNIKIPLPPLAEQKRIVAILDRFDALCNSLSEGLPAEIELRQKQYEYYRDKLLSFKEAG